MKVVCIMTGKFFLYLLMGFIVIFAMDSLNINNLFKKNRVFQARIMYFLIFMCLTYLTTNLIFDVSIGRSGIFNTFR